MSLASQSSPFAAILTNLVSRVSAALNIGTAFVHSVSTDQYKVTELENLFAYIRIFAPSPVDATTGQSFSDHGSGRLAIVVGRRVRIYIYTRSGVDVYGDDTIALGGQNPLQTVETPPAVPGQVIAEEIVLNALQNYQPLNSSGTIPLTIGPIHWIDDQSGPPMRKAEDEDGLIRSSLDFQAVYVACINTQDTAPTSLPSPDQG